MNNNIKFALNKNIRDHVFIGLILLLYICIPVCTHANPPPRTLYYNAFDDDNWSNPLNWWDDAGFSMQAGSLPNSTDIVYLSGTVGSNGGAPASVDTLYFDDEGNAYEINISITVLNGVTLYHNSYIGTAGIVTASDFSFYDSSHNDGTISNSAPPEFYDTTYNSGTIVGDANFNNSSYNTGDITSVASQVAFYDESHNDGLVDGDAYFASTYYDSVRPASGIFTVSQNPFLGSVSGTTYGYEGDPITSYVFNGSYLGATDITATSVTFNNTSYNNGTVHGSGIFNGDLSENNNSVTGTKIRRYTTTATITRDFISTGPWTVEADGAGVVVSITPGIYNDATTFTELDGGVFAFLSTITNSGNYSTSTSVLAQYNNLIAIGSYDKANNLKGAFPEQFQGQAVLVTPSPPIQQLKIRDLKFGNNGEDVRLLQKILINLNMGPRAQELSRIGPTGFFRQYTKNALIEYQKNKMIIPPSGFFGPITRAQMKSINILDVWW